MSLKPVHDKLCELQATPSSLDKKELLKEYMNDELFNRVVQYALDSRLVYHVKSFPKFKAPLGKDINPDRIFTFLDQLASQDGTNAADKKKLFMLASTDEETYEVVRRICNKDLRCGVGVKTINEVIPNAIFYIPYCRCSTQSKIGNVEFPAFFQKKADGAFANVFISKQGAGVAFLTRDGNKLQQLTKLAETLAGAFPDFEEDMVLHGELLIHKDGKTWSRKKGNGIFSSCLHGTAKQDLADCAILEAWDIMPAREFWDDNVQATYDERFSQLSSMTKSLDDPALTLIPTEYVRDMSDVTIAYARMREQGHEGGIVKDFKAPWKDHTSTLQIKLKNVIDVDLVLVGIGHGAADKKFEHCVGHLICESACGEIKVNIGTGLSEKERGYRLLPDGSVDMEYAKEMIEWWESQFSNIIHSECESVIKGKTNSHHSLYLPRYIEVRRDKNTADTLKGLIERGVNVKIKDV